MATFRAMKHDPMGGGADRRWRDITGISSPPTSQCLTEVPYEGLHMPMNLLIDNIDTSTASFHTTEELKKKKNLNI